MIDDFLRFTWIFFLTNKYEFFYAFVKFCKKIKKQIGIRALAQIGVVEWKNHTLQEMARTMLCDQTLPKMFWAEAVNTTCYICNRIIIQPILDNTPFELFYNKISIIAYFKVFGSNCFIILNTKDNLDKFDVKSDEDIFLSYSLHSKAYIIF